MEFFMDISSITSELSTQTGYSEKDLNGFLSNRMDHYNKLTERAEEILAAASLQKTVNTEEKVILPAVGCSLGNIDIAKKLRDLASVSPEEYYTAVSELRSSDSGKFINALKSLTKETGTTLLGKLSNLDQGGVARFVNSLNQLLISEDDAEESSGESGESVKTDLENLCAALGKIVGIEESKLAQTVKGIQIYV